MTTTTNTPTLLIAFFSAVADPSPDALAVAELIIREEADSWPQDLRDSLIQAAVDHQTREVITMIHRALRGNDSDLVHRLRLSHRYIAH
jgi:hypothetical protein